MGKNWGHGQQGRYHGRSLSPNHSEEADETFKKQLREVSQSLALVLEECFNLPDAYWK